MMSVSIIVPVYNSIKYIKNCIDNLTNQTLKEIEIICIDDGSFDDSLALLRYLEISTPNMKVITQSNRGLGAARNAGLKIASGEYIGFVDIDDTVDLNFYQILYEKAKLSDADIVYAPFKYISNNKKIIENVKPGEYINFTDIIPILNNGAVTNKLFRRDKIKNLLFPEGIIYEDNVFLISVLSQTEKMLVIDNVFYNYIIKENSLTTSEKLEHKRNKDSLIVAEKVINCALPHCKLKKDKEALIYFIMRSFVLNRWQKKQYADSFQALFGTDKEIKKIADNYKLHLVDRIFSIKIQEHKIIIYILGIKFTFKRDR